MSEIGSSRLRFTAAQAGIWFAQQLDLENHRYNIGEYLEIDGAVDSVLLEAAARQVIAEVDALRVHVVQDEREPSQVLVPEIRWALPVVDVSGEIDPKEAADAWIRADLATPIDLTVGPLFGFALIKLTSERFFFFLRYHHVAMDGFGSAWIAERILDIYRARLAGDASPVSSAPLSELLDDEERYRLSQDFTDDRRYWMRRFEGRPDPVTLSGRAPRTARGVLSRITHVDADTMAHVRRAARDAAVPWSVVVVAAIALYLQRMTGAREVVLGLPVTARRGRVPRRVPGMVSNVIPLRLAPRPSMTIAQLLKHVAEEIKPALRHQRYRYEDLRRDLDLATDDVSLMGTKVNIFSFGNDLRLGEHRVTAHKLSTGPVDDLAINVYEQGTGGGLHIGFEAHPDHYREEEVEAHQRQLAALLHGLATASQVRPVGQLDVLDASERRQVLLEFNDTPKAVPPSTLPLLFEAQVARTPDAVAVADGGGTLTYAELNERANRLARMLIERGVGSEGFVALGLPRSPELLVSVLAILKTGAAYLPLDLSYPTERLAFMIADGQPELVLTTTDAADRFPAANVAQLVLDQPETIEALEAYCGENVSDLDRVRPLLASHPAYVIYTSGSTGRPKGVVVAHESVVHLVAWAASTFGPAGLSRVVASTSLNFDVSVFEIFCPLMVGGRIELLRDLLALAESPIRWTVSLVSAVPSAFSQLLSHGGIEVEAGTVVLAGEALSARAVRDIRSALPGSGIANIYGPTEATVYATAWYSDGTDREGPPPIGKPITNTRVYVLDSALRPAPVGAPGELYIGGRGLARGYLHRAGLTSERFVANPFEEPGARMYRTGDLVRWNARGELEYLGRTDAQVKVRGFRIELGEVETALLRHEDVAEAVAIVREEDSGQKRLVAYLVPGPAPSATPTAAKLREFLGQVLPEYMVPAAFVVLERLPLNPNGKLDRKALPSPDATLAATSSRRGPRNAQEEILCRLFADALGLPQVGVDDSFFDLGGDSIVSIQLVSRARAAGLLITPRDVFQQKTVEALVAIARVLDHTESAGSFASLALAPAEQMQVVRAARPDAVDVMPLSPLQQGLFFHAVYDEQGPDVYTMQFRLDLTGQLNPWSLAVAARTLLRRHPNMCAGFWWEGLERPAQFTQDKFELPWATHDLSAMEEAEKNLQLARLLAEDREQRFDLTRPPLLRFTVVKLAERQWCLVFTGHHILIDGWSMPVFLRELFVIYERGGDDVGLLRPTPYRDYLSWLASRDRGLAEVAWRQALAGIEEPTLIAPADAARRAMAPEKMSIELPIELTRRIRDQARVHGVTLATVLQAVWGVVLGRLTGRDDVVFGTTVSGRSPEIPGIESMVGLFINTLPVRVRLDPNQSLAAMLTELQDQQAELMAHHHLGLTDIQNAASIGELFDTLVVLENYPLDSEAFRILGHDLRLAHADAQDATHYPLSLVGIPGQCLRLNLNYRPDLFEHDTIAALMFRLQKVLDVVVDNPDLPLGRIDLVTPIERENALVAWNDTGREIPQATFPELFAAQVARTPQATAIVAGDISVTYAQLDALANRLAHRLVEHGVGPERIVALALPRSVDIVVAQLAVLKAGGAYLPVDPDYPPERVEFMLTDAKPIVVVTREKIDAALPALEGAARVILDRKDTRDDLRGRKATPPVAARAPLTAMNSAYVIYTSGSTGRPKGVTVTHAGLASFLAAEIERFAVTPDSRVLMFSSPSFDASVLESCMALLSGAALIVPPPGPLAGDALAGVLAGREITHALIPPAALASVPEVPLPSLRTLIVGGDACSGELVLRWSPNRWMVNAYGPTESTVMATTSGPLSGGENPPIGTPIHDTHVYVLDSALRLSPEGVAGELYIAGAGLARGYLGRPDLTADRFVANPFGAPGARMYRTGDLARWTRGGQLEFVGRVDDQVKVRGFRIELGEVEAVLGRHPSVAQVSVVARKDGPGNKRLVAYVVVRDQECDQAALRSHAAESLPDHMVPSAFVILDDLPLTSNGKLDKKALPAPVFAASSSGRASRNPQEEVLCGLFAEVLGVPEVGIDDDFFQLGGDSIVSIQLVSRARTAGLVITPRDVFQQKTVEALAAVAGIAERPAASLPDEGIGAVSLTPIMHWLRERGGPIDGFFQSMVLQVPAALEMERLAATLAVIVDHHDALRMRLARTFDNDWTLSIAPRGQLEVPLTRVDVLGVLGDALRAQITEQTVAAQARLSPEAGVMLQAVWFDAGPEQSGRLLLVLHHLVVDGVSWRILVADLAAAWEAVVADRSPSLLSVGTSFRRWATLLRERATDPARVQELPAWLAILENPDPPLSDRPMESERHTVATSRTLSFTLSKEFTAPLLTTVPALFHAGINDVLLTGLALAVADFRRRRAGAGRTDVLLDLEGHGRQDSVLGAELSQTVGWFTSAFPIRLDPGPVTKLELQTGAASVGTAIKRVKEQLRSVPDYGIGYGMLRYLNEETAPRLAELRTPQLGFNYLGRFPAAAKAADWAPAPESGGLSGGADAGMSLAHVLDINAVTLDQSDGPRLIAFWSYPDGVFSEEEIRELAESWFHALQGLVTHASQPRAGGFTPADLPLVALSQHDIERIESARPDLIDILPLSPLQHGLLFHAHYDDQAPDLYTEQFRLDLEGQLDPARLRVAARALLHRYPNLRSGFWVENLEQAVQFVPAGVDVPWVEYDLSALSPEARDAEVSRLLEEDCARRFDLSRPPLMRFTVMRLGDRKWCVLITAHHIVIDGWSMPVLLQDLVVLYEQRGDEGGLPRPTPYRDYLSWLATRDDHEAKAAWQQALAGIDEPTLLAPAGGARGTVVPERVTAQLPLEFSRRLRAQAVAHGVTLATVLQVAWAVVLGRLTGRDDVVFGTAVSGRPPELPGFESMVGLFINTLPVRVRLDPGASLVAVARKLQDQQAELTAHHHLGLTDIQRAVGMHELFDTLAVLESYPRVSGESNEEDLRLTASIEGRDTTHYPLTLVGTPGEQLRLDLTYRPDVFERQMVEALSLRLQQVFDTWVEDPERPLARIDVLVPEERDNAVDSQRIRGAAPATTLPELFAEQVRRAPDAVAVEFPGGSLTYAQLDVRANRLAHALIERGVGPEELVALALPRSVDMAIAQLAVLKAGGAYLPVDPEYPAERIAFMLADSKPILLVTAPDLTAGLPKPNGTPRLVLDGSLDDSEDHRTTSLPRTAHTAENSAYLIYTSGSTGRPKGVVATHQGLASFALAQVERFAVNPNSRVLMFSSPSFDASVLELCMALPGGATLVVPPSGPLAGDALAAVLSERKITHALIPPAALATIPHTDFPELRTLIVGGEACPGELVARWSPGRRMVNAYGPTESTVVATTSEPLSGSESPPIGRPIANTRVHVLDSALRPVPVGVAGELYIAGIGLARGYLGQPDLTAGRFVADPFGMPGERMYRTGDLARWNRNGELEFVGRSDDQVKVRSFRIEPGEIEAVLHRHPRIAQAAVVAREDRPGEKRLVAYVVLTPGAEVDTSELRAHLMTILPEYMVPSAFVLLDSLPMTLNGKLDKRALPAPDFAIRPSHRAPRSPQEGMLCELFAEVLDLPQIGVDDDFFQLGGHSLLATKLVARVRATLGVPINVRTLLEHPSAARLARAIRAGAEHEPLAVLLPLRTSGAESPIFCLPPAVGIGWSYSGLLRHLPAEHPVYSLQARGLAGDEELPSSVDAVATDYLAQIRAVQPSGPYCLVGWSLGGIVAHRIATQLQDAGEEVALLAMLDATPTPPRARNGAKLDEQDIRAALFKFGGGSALAGLEEEHIAALSRVTTNTLENVIPSINPRDLSSYQGDLMLFVAGREHDDPSALTAAWQPHIDGLIDTHIVDCGHHEMTQPEPIARIGQALSSKLRHLRRSDA